MPWRDTLEIRLFALWKIPLIAWVRPRVVRVDDDGCVVRVPLRRRTRNHVGSMYFGVLSVGADLAGGLVAFREIRKVRAEGGPAVTLVFKDVRGEFLKRADGDVEFACAGGAAVRALVREAARTGERKEIPVEIVATVPEKGPEPVARFTLTLSLKAARTAAVAVEAKAAA